MACAAAGLLSAEQRWLVAVSMVADSAAVDIANVLHITEGWAVDRIAQPFLLQLRWPVHEEDAIRD
jgi:hypothetical protein